MQWDEMATVGRIARAHGLKGEVMIDPETDFPESRFQAGHHVFVRKGSRVEALTIEHVRFHQGRPLVKFEQMHSIDDTEALGQIELRIPEEMLETLPAGTFYHHDLIGCHVTTPDGGAIGDVVDVEGDWGGSRLVIAHDGQEILVPLAEDICIQIDPASRRIVIDPPEGLLELNKVARR